MEHIRNVKKFEASSNIANHLLCLILAAHHLFFQLQRIAVYLKCLLTIVLLPLISIQLDCSSDGKNEATKSRISSSKMAATRLPVNRNHTPCSQHTPLLKWKIVDQTRKAHWTWSTKMASKFYWQNILYA